MSRQNAFRSKRHIWNEPTNSGWYTAFENEFFIIRGRTLIHSKEYTIIDKETQKEMCRDTCNSLDFVKALIYYITDMKNKEIERILLGE